MTRTAVAGVAVVREDVGSACLRASGEVLAGKDIVDRRQAVVGLGGGDVVDVGGV